MKGFDLSTYFAIPALDSHFAAERVLLLASLPAASSVLYEPAKRIVSAPSKRLRSLLVMASAAPSRIDETIHAACAAIELIHLGSLVHDDIMDNAEMRWGLPTVNHAEGPSTALLVGDYFFAKAPELALSAHPALGSLVARTIMQLCEGQAQEMADVGNLERTREAYFSAITGKTGSLLAAACQSGAICAGSDPEKTDALARFGQAFGVAFQLVDDVLDVVSSPRLLGKPTMADVRAGVYTLPVILAKSADPSLAVKDITPELLMDRGMINETLETARSYIVTAKEALGSFGLPKLADLPAHYFDWATSNLIDATYKPKITV